VWINASKRSLESRSLRRAATAAGQIVAFVRPAPHSDAGSVAEVVAPIAASASGKRLRRRHGSHAATQTSGKRCTFLKALREISLNRQKTSGCDFVYWKKNIPQFCATTNKILATIFESRLAPKYCPHN
jgi:hypothetical protein